MKKTTRHKPSARRPAHFRITPATHRILEQIKARDGIPHSVQFERAIILWGESKGITREAT
jgi:hypothetical protein